MVSRKQANVRAILRKAREVKDPLADFAPAVRSCNVNSQLVQIRSYHARDLGKELQEWCLATCRDNMAAMYDRVWAWSDAKKRKQLTSASSRFLVAHDAASGRNPLAYINYRFEEDEGYPVLYCYELQVVRGAQSRGLGRTLMELAEQIAWGSGMSKVMLTVFSENTAAVTFYRKMGYVLDETSPDYVHPSGTHSASGGVSSGTASGAGRSSSTAGAGSGSGSSAFIFNDESGSGSQTASESGSGGCGYHIMSKCAPTVACLQLVQSGVPQQQQHVHVQEDEQQQHQQVLPLRQAREDGDGERRQELEPQDLPCTGSCKRQRTLGGTELQVMEGGYSSRVPSYAAVTPPLGSQAGPQPAVQSKVDPQADGQAVVCRAAGGRLALSEGEEAQDHEEEGQGEVKTELQRAVVEVVRKEFAGSGEGALAVQSLPEGVRLSAQRAQPDARPMDELMVDVQVDEQRPEAPPEEPGKRGGPADQTYQQPQELSPHRGPVQQSQQAQQSQQQGQEENQARECFTQPKLTAESAVEGQSRGDQGFPSGPSQQQQQQPPQRPREE